MCMCRGQAKGHKQQSAWDGGRGADQLPLITTQTLPWQKKKAGESRHLPTFHGSLGMHIRCQGGRGKGRGDGVRGTSDTWSSTWLPPQPFISLSLTPFAVNSIFYDADLVSARLELLSLLLGRCHEYSYSQQVERLSLFFSLPHPLFCCRSSFVWLSLDSAK